MIIFKNKKWRPEPTQKNGLSRHEREEFSVTGILNNLFWAVKYT